MASLIDATVEKPSIATPMRMSPATQRLGKTQGIGSRLFGSAGAAAGLLLPKCPLCWMAISGSFAGAGYTMWGFEIGGVALFLFSLWRVLRLGSSHRVFTLVSLAIAGAIVGCGAWMGLRWEVRLGIWIAVLLGSLCFYRSPRRVVCTCASTDTSETAIA